VTSCLFTMIMVSKLLDGGVEEWCVLRGIQAIGEEGCMENLPKCSNFRMQ